MVERRISFTAWSVFWLDCQPVHAGAYRMPEGFMPYGEERHDDR